MRVLSGAPSSIDQRPARFRLLFIVLYKIVMTRKLRAVSANSEKLTAKQKRELAALAALPDDRIDTRDIPELPASAWKNAVRGRFYRPVKQAVSLRLDADVVEWLRRPGKGYQKRANAVLRPHMLADLRKA